MPRFRADKPLSMWHTPYTAFGYLALVFSLVLIYTR